MFFDCKIFSLRQFWPSISLVPMHLNQIFIEIFNKIKFVR